MKRFIKPGYVLGVVAVVLAMSGSAVASSLITGKQIKNNSLTGDDIRNGSIGVSDLSQVALDGMQGPRGATGPGGATGPAGAPGTPGAPGLAGIVSVESAHFSLAPGAYSPSGAYAQCPAGKVVIGTGFVASIAHTGFVKAYGTFVGGFIYNDTSVTVSDLHFQAICASTGAAVASAAGAAKTSGYERDRRDAIARFGD